MFWTRHDFAVRSCCDLGLQGSNPNVSRDTLSQYGDHSCEIIVKFDYKSQILCAGNFFAENSYCDLDLQGSDPNIVRDTSSQHGDHLYEIVFKYDFK